MNSSLNLNITSSQDSNMTKFLSVKDLLDLIKEIGLENVLLGVKNQIKNDYLRWNQFYKSSRTANHSSNGVIELMPISNNQYFSFKYVNGHPDNTKQNLPTIMAFSVLSDMNTGIPLLITESTILTAIRTACTSVMMAQLLARKNSKSMAVIGNGAQSEFQILAFYYLMGINDFHLYDIDEDATYKLIKNLDKYPINYKIYNNTKDCVKKADIITTITADKKNSIILDETMIKAGQHINAVGGDCPGKTELSKGVLNISNIFVEYLPQSKMEGEIQQYSDTELNNKNITEIWELLDGIKNGRNYDDEITLFDSVGFALEDYSTIKYFYDQLINKKKGINIDIIAHSTDPKNLFGLLTQ
jgi:ornithine cyclodeaminase